MNEWRAPSSGERDSCRRDTPPVNGGGAIRAFGEEHLHTATDVSLFNCAGQLGYVTGCMVLGQAQADPGRGASRFRRGAWYGMALHRITVAVTLSVSSSGGGAGTVRRMAVGWRWLSQSRQEGHNE